MKNHAVLFFFQAEDGIRDTSVTGVQTCALPICRSLDSPSENAGYCGGDRPRAPGDSHVLDAWLGVYAPSGRRLPPLYAYHYAGYFHRRVAETSAADGSDLDEFSGSRSCPGQSGARRYSDRSGATLHARDRHRPQAAIGMERCSHLVLLLGATVAPSRSTAHHARPHFATTTRCGDEPGAENPRPLEFLDHAHPGTH